MTVFDRIDVMLIPGNENIVQLDGKEAEEVELINKNGKLKIRMPLTKLLQGDNISVTVYFNNLIAVEANEGSRIACGEKIKTTTFDIIAKEGSEIKLNLDVEKLNARVSNGSKIIIEGKANNQNIVVKSGGTFEAQLFETKRTDISVKAGGGANIFATDLVDVELIAGGHVTIYSSPKQINQNIVGSGTICQVLKKK